MEEVVRMISSPQEIVYLAGHELQILYYSVRDNASKFIYAYPLMSGPFQKEFREEFYLEMNEELPDYIVLSAEHYKPEDNQETVQRFWNRLIKISYDHVGSVIRKEDKVYWDLDEQKSGRSLLFKKK